MTMDEYDLEQRFAILEILEKQIICLENTELSGYLSRFKSRNVEWILTELQGTLGEMQEALDMEEFSRNWS